MPARHKKCPRHCGFSDDEGDCCSSPQPHPVAALPQPNLVASGQPAASGGGAVWQPAQQYQAPAACRAGAELTPQQVAAATSGKRAKVIGVGGFGKVGRWSLGSERLG